YKKLFESYDMILTPVTPTTAPLLGSITDPIQSYKNDLFTVPANLAGLPSLSIPIGMIDGLPVGVLLTGDHFSEQILINAAYAIER
ncbi:MAG: Asp-tRNA(Asn)/Glu-tRNA(Gln) amidotransferase subunit GatA, partial [Eubacterium sp.]|nr:Asp-tRNA(Asn)/Glu-tRNA(Gln) amidotransferase subunit GatA [Eubacterium sp.]